MNNDCLIMTSKEISHLVGEDHNNVMVVLSKGLISAGLNSQVYFTLPKTRQGKQRRVLVLPYEVSSGYGLLGNHINPKLFENALNRNSH